MSRRAGVLILLMWAMACQRSLPVTHDAYIWQRRWTPAVDRAALASASHIAAWRVLAMEIDAREHVVESTPHLDVLAASGKPVTPVIRISGRASAWPQADIIQRTLAIVQRWRQAGVAVSGIEIDHDCGTASLRQYASFLRQLQQARPRGISLSLSITALPAWLDSEFLSELLSQVNETVLQVHAVQHPSLGLFDAERAQAWAAAWSKVSAVPFRIALPTYGSRVTWTPAGSIIAIESEAPTLAGQGGGDPTDSRELFAAPRDIIAFIDTLRRDPPSHFVGFAWFRLPSDEDERAWSLATWHAVIDGRPLAADISVVAERHATIPGLYTVFLRNRGEVEDAVPAGVTVTGTCEAADAVAPYAMEKRGEAIEFYRVAPRLLALRQQTVIGWVRCASGEVRVHAHS